MKALFTGAPSALSLRDLPCAAVGQTTGESPREVALRRWQHLEDRVIDEDEEGESDRNSVLIPPALSLNRPGEGV